MVLSSTLPSVGAGALKNRDDPKILGTSKVGWVFSDVDDATDTLFFFVLHRNLGCYKLLLRSTRRLRLSVREPMFL